MTKWRPIETAPMDKEILLWHTGSKWQKQGPVIGHIMRMGIATVPVFGCTVFHPGDATHWMPLPEPPKCSS
jgi:hypothetical protein